MHLSPFRKVSAWLNRLHHYLLVDLLAQNVHAGFIWIVSFSVVPQSMNVHAVTQFEITTVVDTLSFPPPCCFLPPSFLHSPSSISLGV